MFKILKAIVSFKIAYELRDMKSLYIKFKVNLQNNSEEFSEYYSTTAQ